MENFHHVLSTSTTNEFGEKYLYSINGNLFLNKDSNTIYSNKYGKKFLKENSVYIIIGTDSGLFVKYILKQKIPSGTKIVFVDFKEIIDWIYENQNIYLNDDISLITKNELNDHLNSIKIEKYSYINNINYIQSFCSTDNKLLGYFSLSKQIIEFLQSLQWKKTAQLNNRLFLINQLKNLPENKIHASFLYGQFKGQSALLLAGGPSLDTFIPWIQQHREQYVVLAVSRISRRLIKANITPDIIFSVDPQEISFDVSREMFHFTDQSIFIHSYHVFPPMAAQWSGKKAFLGPLFPWSSPLNIPDRIPRGVTVTNVALSCALEMGFSQIVLCGVDLCYSPEGHTHASHSKNREHGPVVEGAETKIETNAGTLAESLYAYEIAAKHIESLAQHEIAQDCCIINPNLYAAKMKGVVFKEIDTIVPTEISKKNIQTDHFFTEETAKHLRCVSKELGKIRNNLYEIKQLSKFAIKENKMFFKKNIKTSKKSRLNMEKIEKRLHSDELIDTTNLVKNFGVDHFIKLIHLKRVEEITEVEAKNNLNDYYEAFIKSSNLLLGIFNELEVDIEIRNEEINNNINFNKLFEYYEKNNIPGRYKILQSYNEIYKIDNNCINNDIFRLKLKFDDIINGNINYSTKYNQNWNEWSDDKERKLIIKLIEYYKSDNKIDIERTIKIIDSSNNQSIANISLFSNGLLSEMHCEYSDAIDLYNQIIDDSQNITPNLLEATLKRIASISIANNDQENSLLALKCLNEISIEYAPQYAKLLKLTQHTHDALDVYAHYIEKFPHDIRTMLDMAMLYSELSIPEGVMLLTDHILEQDPDNMTARQLRASHAE